MSKEYKSDMEQIISAPPPWMARWGMTLIFLIIVGLVGLSAWIPYPERIKMPVCLKVNSFQANELSGKVIIPIKIQMRKSAALQIKDGQIVWIKGYGSSLKPSINLKVKVSGKAEIVTGDSILISVIELDKGTISSNQIATLENNLPGEVEIIIEKNSLFDKIMKSIIKKGTPRLKPSSEYETTL